MSESSVGNTGSDAEINQQQEPISTFNRSPLHIVRVVISTVLLVLWCVVMLIIHGLWRLFKIPHLERSYFLFHGGCCRLFNIKCRYEGSISEHRPTLFLANHVSYLDVFVLGRSLPGYFIAKSEVAGWPILGMLAKVQNTLFFERKSKKVRGQLSVMTEHFDREGNLILFPEGTSTDGTHVQPFKSSLLQAVEQSTEEVWIQPVTLSYARYRGQMMDKATRDQYAWYASMSFAPHFFNALGLHRAEVIVTYHQPVRISDFENRKACAQYCQQQVIDGLVL